MFVRACFEEESRVIRAKKLFVSESDHGVDAHGASRGDVTRRHGHNHQQHGDAGKGQRIMRTDAEELVGHETRQS